VKWLTLDSKSLQPSAGTIFGREKGEGVYLYFVVLLTLIESFFWCGGGGGVDPGVKQDVSGATVVWIFVFLRMHSRGKACGISDFSPAI
jgi:hypothetical protein